MTTGIMYAVQDNVNTIYAEDINQATQALMGNADVTQINLFQPIAVPGAPTVAINTTAGNLNGAYKYAIIFVTGIWEGPSGTGTLLAAGNTGIGTASASVSPASQQVNLTNIPTGPTGTVARIICRTKAGGSTYYVVTQINDNTATSYTDNTADTSLTTAAATSNTTGTALNAWTATFSGAVTLNAGATVANNANIYVNNTGITSGTAQAQWTANSTVKIGGVNGDLLAITQPGQPWKLALDVNGNFAVAGTIESNFVNHLNSTANQVVHEAYQVSGVARWKWVTETDAAFSLYGYDSSGGTPTVVLRGETAGGLFSMHNTLDDGSGGASFNGNVQFNASYAKITNGSIAQYIVSTNGASSATNPEFHFEVGRYNAKEADIISYDGTNVNILMSFNSSKAVATANNILDDGGGSATLKNAYVPTSGGFVFQGTAGAMRYNSNQLYWVCGPSGYYWANNANNSAIMTLDNSGDLTVQGAMNAGGVQLGDASGTWTPAAGSFNVGVGTVINVAAVPSGTKFFHAQVAGGANGNTSGQWGITTSAGSAWIVGPGGSVSSTQVDSGYSSGISSTNINGGTVSSFYDGQYYANGYFQINGGYLQFVVTGGPYSSGAAQNTIRWAVA